MYVPKVQPFCYKLSIWIIDRMERDSFDNLYDVLLFTGLDVSLVLCFLIHEDMHSYFGHSKEGTLAFGKTQVCY